MTTIKFGGTNSGTQVAQNYGSVHIYPDRERPRSPPTPTSTVPFRRDPDFVDRGDILDKLCEKAFVQGSITALVGLGGVGKSQLAIEYSYRVRDKSPKTWVFWIHASNATRFEQSFREIAKRARINGYDNSDSDVFQIVQDWLLDEKNGHWALIIDNLDDDSFMHQPLANQEGKVSSDGQAGAFWDYLPQTLPGSIVVTSRDRNVALKIMEHNEILSVGPMDSSNAVLLLEKKLGPHCQQGETVELATALDFMPLAITQAASYIRQRAPRFSVQQYLEALKDGDREGFHPLSNDEEVNTRRDKEAQNAIFSTWQISFDHIRQTTPGSANLLALMSFFDRQGIPDFLLYTQVERNYDSTTDSEPDNSELENPEVDHLKVEDLECGDAKSEGSESYDPGSDNPEVKDSEADGSAPEAESDLSEPEIRTSFEDDITVLRNYSLISIGTNPKIFEMHRLVQVATQQWLRVQNQVEMWQKIFLMSVYVNLPIRTEEVDNWPTCQLIFPHIQQLVTQKPQSRASLLKWSSVMHRTAEYTCSIGEYAGAEKMALLALNARRSQLGPESPKTLTSSTSLAFAYMYQGKLKQGEQVIEEVLKVQKRIYKPNHIETLHSMETLAIMYQNQGRWEEAEELYTQVRNFHQRKYGTEDVSTIGAMHNLAGLYVLQSRWEEAERLLLTVVDISKRILGPVHPNTLASMASLASTYDGQKRWEESEELRKRLLVTQEQVLGPEHPDTLIIFSGMVAAYNYQERWEEAEELSKQIINGHAKVLGPEHPRTLDSMASLASTYQGQSRWEEAEELYTLVMDISKRALGPDHTSTLQSMEDLSVVYEHRKRWEEAEELRKQVMNIRMRVLGPEQVDTLHSMVNLGLSYYHQQRWEEAAELQKQALDISKRVLGPEHPDILRSMIILGSTYNRQKRWEEAVELNAQALDISRRVLGPEHPDTLKAMHNQAWNLREIGRLDDAISLMEECVRLKQKVFGPDDQSTNESTEDLEIWRRSRRLIFLSPPQSQHPRQHQRSRRPQHPRQPQQSQQTQRSRQPQPQQSQRSRQSEQSPTRRRDSLLRLFRRH